ncbi:hypothetical protein [Streptococcus infantarius]|uniref:hypothetical protein n=1 Tax=Streptococcus infantarius TaxID=102684 RepID=UPI003C2611D1
MGIIAAGQITVVDVSDAPVLNAFITASQPTTQVYSQTSGTYNPSYADTPQVLTLNLTKAGSTASILGGVSKVMWYVVDDSGKHLVGEDAVSGDQKEKLTVKGSTKPDAGSRHFEVNGVWRDPITGLDVQFSADIDLFVVQIGKETQILNVYAGNGNTFRNNLPASLTVNADLYRGNVLTNDSKQFKFFYQDTSVTGSTAAGYDADGGIGWHLCSSTTAGQTPNVEPTATTTSQGILTVTPAVVTNAQSFKVVCINKTAGLNNSKSTGLCTLLDMSDPYQLLLDSSAGNIFKNRQGSTALKALLYRNGEELDTDGTGKTYKWTKYDKNGVMDVNFGGTGNAYKTGKSITVNATEIEAKANFKCEVWE